MTDENFTDKAFKNKVKGFTSPTKRPESAEQRAEWQKANKEWWTNTPMKYDWREGIEYPLHSAEYFKDIDDRFFESARPYMPWKDTPFEKEIPFDKLPEWDVLEIGVGQGSHASLIAPRAKSFNGIDLTDPATEATTLRMELMGLSDAKIQQMDAEAMRFADNSFDYIWSWGVIHHSSDTRKILEEMHRVLKAGGHANVMVYHRSFWKYYVHDGFFKGILQNGFSRNSFVGANQLSTDGAIARYYTKKEWRALVEDIFDVDGFSVTGLKIELLPLPAGRVKETLAGLIPNAVSRFFTNSLGWGSFLNIRMTKKSSE